METTIQTKETMATSTFITSEALLEQWQGHRRVTRRVIEAFPEDKLFDYSIGGMRTFAALAMEMIHMGAPGIRGVVTHKWQTFDEAAADYPTPKTKSELLHLWDESTDQINNLWPQIPPGRFQEMETFFGQYEGRVYWNIL